MHGIISAFINWAIAVWEIQHLHWIELAFSNLSSLEQMLRVPCQLVVDLFPIDILYDHVTSALHDSIGWHQ